jgi:hypothetical protein
MNPIPVYDIEGEIESAIVEIMNQQVESFSIQDNPAIRRPIGRLEVMVKLGAGKDRHLAISESTGLEIDVEDAWNAVAQVQAITKNDAATHRAYRSWARFVMARLPPLINTGKAPGLVNHVIYGPMYHQGSSVMYEPQKGYYHTMMQYGFFVSVHNAAWATLTQ